jgi:hypothetical protein
MKQCILLLLTTFLLNCLLANDNDTVKVKVLFNRNDWQLTDSAKAVLNDVAPDDSTITLKKISIYGFAGRNEKSKGKTPLAIRRAEQVKQYLLKSGIDARLFVAVDTKEPNNPEELELKKDEVSKQSAIIIIEYEAKLIEETIIIQSTRKKKPV